MIETQESTRPEDRVPFGQKLALGVGAFSNITAVQIVQVMALPIFQIVLGVHPMLVGLALTLHRAWDALIDPVMGYVTDNYRSRLGRRRPFILVGSLLMAVTFAGLWMAPQGWSARLADSEVEGVAQTPTAETAAAAERAITGRDWALFAWLLVGGVLFYTAFSVYSVPLVSLSYEMTPDYHERTRVMAYWGFFTLTGQLLINAYYPLTERTEYFANPLIGARWIGLVVGLVIFLGFGILPGLFTRERFYRAAAEQEKIRFWPAIAETLRSRNMLVLLATILTLSFVGAMAAALALYIVIFYVCGGDREYGSVLNAWNGVGFQIVGFASVPLLTWLATRVGKRNAMFLVLALAALGGVAKWFLYSPELFFTLRLPESLGGTVRLHWLLLDPLLSGPIWVALGMLVPAMMADLCDVDEYEFGKRREGVFGAVFSWFQQFGFSLTFIFAAAAVWLSGFDEKFGAHQPAGAMLTLRWCFAGFSVLAMVLGMIVLLFYNVDDKRAYQVRSLLEQRRGKR